MSQVSKLLAMQAYAKPHYLALGLTEDERVDGIEDDLVLVEDLEKLDPLRRALRLAKKAEAFDSTGGRTSNLNSNYKAIKEELDTFSCSILTQCKDMEEVETILEHRPVYKIETRDSSKQSPTKTKTFKQSKTSLPTPTSRSTSISKWQATVSSHLMTDTGLLSGA